MKHLVLALGLVALPVKQKQESLLSPIQPLTPYIQTSKQNKTIKNFFIVTHLFAPDFLHLVCLNIVVHQQHHVKSRSY